MLMVNNDGSDKSIERVTSRRFTKKQNKLRIHPKTEEPKQLQTTGYDEKRVQWRIRVSLSLIPSCIIKARSFSLTKTRQKVTSSSHRRINQFGLLKR